jgi:hypothetical protein
MEKKKMELQLWFAREKFSIFWTLQFRLRSAFSSELRVRCFAFNCLRWVLSILCSSRSVAHKYSMCGQILRAAPQSPKRIGHCQFDVWFDTGRDAEIREQNPLMLLSLTNWNWNSQFLTDFRCWTNIFGFDQVNNRSMRPALEIPKPTFIPMYNL